MTKEDYVKVYSLWPRTSQISVEGEKKIHDADKKIDVPEDDGNDEPENTDTLIGENADGIDEDTNEDNPVIESEILQYIEQDNSGETKPDDANNKSSGSSSSENTGPKKSDEKETGISSENTDMGKKDQKETAVINEQSKCDIPVEKQKEDNEDSSKVESEEKDDMAKDPHFDLKKTDNPSEDSKSPSDKDESTSEPMIKWKPNKKKNKQSVHNPAKENEENESKGTGKAKSKKKDSNTVQTNSEVNDDDEEGIDFGYFCDKYNRKFTDWNELQKHKYECVKLPWKHVCPTCNRGFQQKCLMTQCYNFYHTKKPKKYVCKEHKKMYVYKKSLDEHKRRDHSDGNFKFVCDFCGRGFFHQGEFSIHRTSVHLNRKDYLCN